MFLEPTSIRIENHNPKGGEGEKMRHIEGDPFWHVFNYMPPELGNNLSMDLINSKPIFVFSSRSRAILD
jgi:hypothetical protein